MTARLCVRINFNADLNFIYICMEWSLWIILLYESQSYYCMNLNHITVWIWIILLYEYESYYCMNMNHNIVRIWIYYSMNLNHTIIWIWIVLLYENHIHKIVWIWITLLYESESYFCMNLNHITTWFSLLSFHTVVWLFSYCCMRLFILLYNFQNVKNKNKDKDKDNNFQTFKERVLRLAVKKLMKTSLLTPD